jgi:DNA mismatch endonuclease (patch repair protein)
MDTLTPAQRSERMSRVRNKDTKPERVVRRLVYGLGYRYRLQYGALPGRPDLAFPGRRKAITVHGCFWHRHAGCALARMPKSRLSFWVPKLEGNKLRDERNAKELAAMGWKLLVVWECELDEPEAVRERIRAFLGVAA